MGMKEYYKKICFSDGTKQDEHRYLMEQHLGIKLKSNQVVHHINGNKLDNRLENLVVMNRGDHAKLHGKSYVASKETRAKLSTALMGKQVKAKHKIKDEQILYALKLYGDGARIVDIQRKTGFSHSTFFDFLNGSYVRCLQFSDEVKQAKKNRELANNWLIGKKLTASN
jgi:hypothetical protein